MTLTVTVIIPMRNAESTVGATLDSLARQQTGGRLERVLVVDDASSDGGLAIAKSKMTGFPCELELVRHDTQAGLAACYNAGIERCRTPLYILMHSDMSLPGEDALVRMVEPMERDEAIVATYPTVVIPYAVWKNYGFWAKCMFSRQVDRRHSIFSGKFDCIRRSALRFDAATYVTGGEDADFYMRLKETGRIEPSQVEVHHLHNMDPAFSIRQWMRKESQFGEIYGTQVRLMMGKLAADVTPASLVSILVRPAIVLGLLVPGINLLAGTVAIAFAFAYTLRVYRECWRDWRILLLPWVNLATLVVHTLYFLRGAASGRQRVR